MLFYFNTDLIFLFLVIMQHSVLGDLTLCLYYIQKYILFFFMHNFSLCKQKGNFEISDPPYSLGGVRCIFNTSACMHGHLYLSVMHVFVFLCILWFALLLRVNFCKHERKQQKILWRTHAIM